MKLSPGDRTQAEALRIAEDWLKKMGWRFTPADVGARAKEIIAAMSDDPGRAALEERGE